LADRNCTFEFTDKVAELLIKISKEEHGKNATLLKRLISKEIEPCISDILLSLDSASYKIIVDVKGDEFVCRKRNQTVRKKVVGKK